MIRLESSSLLTRYFVWSCDHLPLTAGNYVVKDGEKEMWHLKTGRSYLESGTTLCHIFWAIFWVPVLGAAIIGSVAFYIGGLHFLMHRDFMRGHPDAGPLLNVAAYFMVEWVMLGIALFAGCVILAIIGGSKTGFFSLLWQYLKGIKERVCPLVQFDRRQP